MMRNSSTMKRSRGSTLAISLVILTSVTLGAVYAMQQSASQLKMVATMEHNQTITGYSESCNEGGFKHLRSNIARLGDATRANQLDQSDNLILDDNNQPLKRSIDVYLDEADRISSPDYLQVNCSFVYTGNRNGAGIVLADGSSVGQSRDFFFEITADVVQEKGDMRDQRTLGFFYRAFTGG